MFKMRNCFKKFFGKCHHNKKNIAVFLFLTLIAFILYFPALKLGFFSDDYHMLHTAQNFDGVGRYFASNIIGERIGSTYGPIMNIFFELEYFLFGLNPFGYHFIALLLYSSTAFVLFLLVKKLLPKSKKRKKLALLSAMVFLLLPNHAEAAIWVAVLPHVLASFFFLLAIYFYLLFIEKEKRKHYIFAFLSIFLSLFTKEIGITFIGVFILLEWFFGKKDTKKRWLRLLPFAFLIAVYLFLRKYATGVLFGYYGKEQLGFSFVKVYHMFSEIFASMFLSFPQRIYAVNIFEKYVWFFILFSFVFLLFLYKNKKDHKHIFLFFLLSFLGSLVPYFDILMTQMNNEGERYAYLPSLFFAPLLVFAVSAFLRIFPFRKFIAFVLFLFFVLSSKGQIDAKLHDWNLADKEAKKFINSFDSLDLNEEHESFLIGVPDNFEGAQVMRNAGLLAYELQTGKKLEAERLFASSFYKEGNSTQVNVNYLEGKIHLTSEGDIRMFTGLARFDTEDATISLLHFDNKMQDASIIELLLKENYNKNHDYYFYNGEVWEKLEFEKSLGIE